MKAGKHEAARAKWRKLIEEQARSGQTAAAFCRARGMWPSCFFLWKRKLATPKVAPAAFVEVGLAAAPPAPGIVVELGASLRLRVERGFDAELLRQVVEALDAGIDGEMEARA